MWWVHVTWFWTNKFEGLPDKWGAAQPISRNETDNHLYDCEECGVTTVAARDGGVERPNELNDGDSN